jgi:hypothetical protein
LVGFGLGVFSRIENYLARRCFRLDQFPGRHRVVAVVNLIETAERLRLMQREALSGPPAGDGSCKWLWRVQQVDDVHIEADRRT